MSGKVSPDSPNAFVSVHCRGRIRWPLWHSHHVDAASAAMANAIVVVVIFLFLVPWDHVVRNHVIKPDYPRRTSVPATSPCVLTGRAIG